VWSGLTWATALAFSPDGKVYVAQKNGVVKVFSSLAATTSTVFANVSYRTHDYWDRGLLGLVVDPRLGTPGHNFVYVLYTYDGAPPRWNDVCKGPPDGPGPTTDGCVVDARLSRFPVNPDGTAGIEQPLIDGNWCQQFPSHSIGHLAFLPDGSLVVSAGEGASFENPDYGQFGGTVVDPATGQPYTRANPCGDPPNGLGVANTAPTGRGGALRSQSLRASRRRTHPARRDDHPRRPSHRQRAPREPAVRPREASGERRADRGVRAPEPVPVHGPARNLRGLDRDVGLDTWEEIDRLTSPTPPAPVNFGWPCYEGSGQTPGYNGLNQCLALYADSTNRATGPYATYQHGVNVIPGDGCSPSQGSVISAISFEGNGNYPPTYDGALFFGDHSRNCIWAMLRGSDGLPDPNNIRALVVDPNAHPSTSRPTPRRATSSTCRSKVARSTESGTSQGTSRRSPWPPRARPAGGAPHRVLRRQRVERPRRRHRVVLVVLR
jgi:hypothetical protein